MKIVIERINEAFKMKAKNEDGKSVVLDASPEVGGNNDGLRPMQLLLASLGSCSAIDIVNIINKQKQRLEGIKITVNAEREKGSVPALFSEINIFFELSGDINKQKAKNAIQLSMEKYCSVARILEKSCCINYDFEIYNP